MTVESASAKFTSQAVDEGLVDVAYAHVDSPIGCLLTAVTRRGLAKVAFPGDDDTVLEELSRRLSPRVLEAPGELDAVRRELDEYFAGSRRRFSIPLDWALARGFAVSVLRETNKIPYGETRTYKQMAVAAGNERAVRATGSALGSNPIPIVVPCHRVLRTGGALGGYGGGLPVKEALLRLEGSYGDERGSP